MAQGQTRGLDQAGEVREIREIALREIKEHCHPSTPDGPGSPGSSTPGVNRPLVSALASSGLLGRIFPPDGSTSASATKLCQVREGLASEATEAESAFALQGLGGYPILQSGVAEVADRWVPRIARGEAIAGFALSEPGAGSDAAAVSCSAERDGRGYRLSGQKKWISNAPWADVYTLFARTTPDAGARGVTAFVVTGDSPGLGGEPLNLLAPHPVGTLELDGVFVGDDHVLGEVDRGFRVAMATLNLFRPSVGAFAVGMAQAALEASIDHADQREAFGARLRDLQAVSHLLADMVTGVFTARLAVYAAAAAYDRGDPDVPRFSAMSKLFATEIAQQVVDSAVQIHGASGLEVGHLVEQLYREVRAPRIYEGTSEIQRNIVAKELFR